jgi:predicted RND superfamily exporter protein
MRKAFFSSAIQGIFYSLLFSALILFVTTRSMVLTFFSLVCIGNVLLTILAFVHLLNWRFGLSESICLIVFIGLSVDYVVHISHSYTSCVD